MLESMTGYGRGEYTSGELRAIVEIRSVNYRYCEISLKMPAQLNNFEQPLKDEVYKKIKRGKVTATVELEHPAEAMQPVQVREDALKTRLQTLKKVCEISGISDPVRLEHLLVFPELFDVAENDPDLLKLQQNVVEKAMMKAVDELLNMRRNEGKNLQKDLEERMESLKSHCNHIRENEKDRIVDSRDRLRERLEQLLENNRIEEDRIEQEITIMADRLDISEELVRMDSHIAYFRECLLTDASQGKKLNFILQEMHREVNTIGSKAAHSGISRKVVEMKEIIENIREQIQNIA